MKHFFKLSFLLLALMLSATASAYDFEVDGIYYNVNGTVVTVTSSPSSNKYSGDVIIPETVTYYGKTYSVTVIGYKAFYNCSGLTSITIPNSVTSIDDHAFSGCWSLTSVTIPNSVTTIREYAFYECTSLSSIEIGNSVTTIDDWAFACDAEEKNRQMSSPLHIIIPNSVTTIGDYAFAYRYNIETIVLGYSVNSIGVGAFEGCIGLTSVTIPNSVTIISRCAFSCCSGLTSVTIPNSVTSIGDAAFYNCSGLTSMTIPNSVTSIGVGAFEECIGLTSVTIPNSVTSIGDGAFSYCIGLTSVTIGNSVTSIGERAFCDCSDLAIITVESDNTTFDSRNNCNAIIETASNTLIVGCKTTVIPNSVTSIGGWAFFGCSGLTSVTIPNSVTSIGSSAFYRCSGLNDVFSFIDDPTTVSMGSDVFCRYPNNFAERTLHVPFGTSAVYQANTSWSQYFGSIVEMEPDPVLAESIKLNVTTAGLNEGATLQLTATVLPEECNNKTVLWASNNPSVATVDSNGLVTTHSVGTATITAITTDGSNLSTTCTVTLLPVGVKGDVNGDSKININDVTSLIDFLLTGLWLE